MITYQHRLILMIKKTHATKEHAKAKQIEPRRGVEN